jgi:hypothetical protein
VRWQLRNREPYNASRVKHGKQRHVVHVTGHGIGIAELHFEGGKCVEAPERLSAAVGRSASELHRYFKRRGWRAELIR